MTYGTRPIASRAFGDSPAINIASTSGVIYTTGTASIAMALTLSVTTVPTTTLGTSASISMALSLTASGYAIEQFTDLLDVSSCDNKVDSQNQIVVPTGTGILPIIDPVINPPNLMAIPSWSIPGVNIPSINIGGSTVRVTNQTTNQTNNATYESNVFNYLNSERYRDWIAAYVLSKIPLVFSYDGTLGISISPAFYFARPITYTRYTIYVRSPSGGAAFDLFARKCDTSGATISSTTLSAFGSNLSSGSITLGFRPGDSVYIECTGVTFHSDVTVELYNL